MELGDDLLNLENLLLAAGDKLLEYYQNDGLQVQTKDDDSLVTAADLASETVILDSLSRLYPADKVYSEEAGLSSEDRTKGSHIWIVDPLDGTTNFANHYPFFCVSIARGRFELDGQIAIELGGVYDPVAKDCFLAEIGQGAFCNRKAIRVRPNRAPEKAFIVTGFSYHKGPQLRRDIDRFLSVAERCQSIRRDGAAALDLAYVAKGIYDGYWEFGLKPWDIAAGSLLVSEAGGSVYNPSKQNSRFDPESEGVLCGSQSIAEYLLKKM